jgi:hypothetical protein
MPFYIYGAIFKMDPKEVGCKAVDWVQLPQNRGKFL